jgi:hypothetical protein
MNNGQVVGQVVYDFFTRIHNYKPDVTHYKMAHNILGPLIIESDDKIRVYDYSVFVNAIDLFILHGLKPTKLTVFRYPELLRAVADNDGPVILGIIKNLLETQDNIIKGNIKPPGW